MDRVDATAFALKQFGNVGLGHRARKNRLLQVVAQLAEAPQHAIPRVFERKAQWRAMYRLMSHESVTHESLMPGPAAQTVQLSEACEKVLVIQDTTHVSLGGRDESSEFGPVDVFGHTSGFLAHSALVVDATRRPIGVVAQETWVRARTKQPKDAEARRQRPRESEKWLRTSTAVEEAFAKAQRRPVIVEVFDAEGDTFAVLEHLLALGHGFVIRAAQNRQLEADDGEMTYLAEVAATAPVRGTGQIEVPSRPGKLGRTAFLTLRSTRVTILPPRSRDRRGEPVDVGIVLAVEESPPAGATPIAWLLLTTEPIDNHSDCLCVLGDYSCRWLVEEFHMALKTGCSLEKRQLRTYKGMTALLALLNPIAVQLLNLRDVSRRHPDLPATELLTPLQLEAVRVLRPGLPLNPTLRQAVHTIATIGGYTGRKSDREPGWRTIWFGLRDVLLVAQALAKKGFG